ncbi:MAG: right-handed parallel beta-helix repeat-containing protein [Bacteroidales bacterium]
MLVDTFTVLNPDNYYVLAANINNYPVDSIGYSILHSKITPKDADLYVNPQGGDNSNSGLTSEEPLKSIAFAYSSIMVDSLEKNTIHLADGIYSDSSNTEKFPLNIRPYINVVGQSIAGTILDGQYKSRVIKGNNEVSNYSFSKMTMRRGGKVDTLDHPPIAGFGVLYAQNDHVTFDSIHFIGGHCYSSDGALSVQASSDVMISNCVFTGTIGGSAFSTGVDIGDTITVKNCIFADNLPDYNNQDNWQGGGMWLAGGRSMAIVQNCLFTGNDQTTIAATASGYHPDFTPVIVNCTFTGNTHLEDMASLSGSGSGLELINCIVYDEGSVPAALYSWESLDTVVLHISHSLFEGGPDAVYLYPGDPVKLIYDESNIDTDPLFYGGFEFPYNLSENSPCIDAGTLELPSFVHLPATDLAGNPRVYGSSIDMGAYEWNPTVGINEFRLVTPEKEKLLKVAPNPFATSTKVMVKTTVSGKVKLEVYNNSGQRVRVLMDGTYLPGTSIVNWEGEDEYNRPLPSGIYHLVLVVDGKEKEEIGVIKQGND